MATKTQTTPSVFPRIRFGFGPKSSRMRFQPDPPESPDDTDWYLPYNGPYELPPPAPRAQDRDSWGQVIGSVLGDLGVATSPTSTGKRIAFPLPASGAYSSHPYRASTAATDTAGASSSRVRGGGPAPIVTSSTAFAHIDNTGGVGESPAPMRRSPMQISPQSSSSSSNRLSLANLLSFGTSTRKSRSDSATSSSHRRPSTATKRGRNATPTPDHQLQSNHSTGIDVHLPPRSHSLAHDVGPSTERTLRQRSNTLIGTYGAPPAPSRQLSTTSPLSAHPYAHAHPTSHSGAPRRAPIVSPPLIQSRSLDKGKGVDRSYQYPQPPSLDTLNVAEVPPHLRPTPRTSLLKTISAPNLRNLSRGISVRKRPTTPSRGKSRWLSPETWCDALLFPRPRFLEHIDGDSLYPIAQRNVSIPAPKAPDMPLGRPWLRQSRSAVNLHVTSDFSRGPPRAEPMLMKAAEGGDRSWSSFSRPRSFALDDLAVPSPVPSLARVLEMGASFERERATWRSQAECALQSSKLTRSLGRCRSQSAGRTRAQLKDMGGVGFLATKTLMGNQLVAPAVGTPTSSEGTQTQQTRSGTSHARTLSSGGHSRAGSKGKIAAMRAATATGLCISGDKICPQDEREDLTTVRYDNVVSIEGQQHLLVVPISAPALSPSPVTMDSATVGIALSSPLPSTEEVANTAVQQQQQQQQKPLTYARDHHPYAQGGFPAQPPPPPPQPHRTHTRSSSDYAGPHPSAVPVTASASDMSARHRLPPQAVLHPYATTSAFPNAVPSQQQQQPESRFNNNPRGPDAAIPHAYAAANRFSSGPLVFADALSYGHQRRFSEDSGLGDSEGHHNNNNYNEAHSSTAQVLAPFPPEYHLRASQFLSFHTVASSSLNQSAAFLSTSPDNLMRRSAQTSSADERSGTAGSRASSPLQSPRPFGTIEDLDRYRNLFYYPKNSVVSGGSPSEEYNNRRTFSSACDTSSFAGLDVSSAGGASIVGGGSGLAALTRQLSNEFGAATTTTTTTDSRWWLRRAGAAGEGAVLSDVYSNSEDMNTDLDDATTLLPLSMHRSLHPPSEGSFTTRIPQDVESHVSSVLEMDPIDDDDDDELLRVGTVDASTPIETTADEHLSFVCDVQDSHPQATTTYDDDASDASDASSAYSAKGTDNDDDERRNDEAGEGGEEGDSTLSPLLDVPRLLLDNNNITNTPHSAKTEGTRSSYMTNESAISGLSDFPVPPNETVVSLDRVKDLLGKRRARAAEAEAE